MADTIVETGAPINRGRTENKAGGSNTLNKPGTDVKMRRFGGDYLPGRRDNPARHPEGPGSGEHAVHPEELPAPEVQAIYKKFAQDFEDDLNMLIKMRKRRGTTDEFYTFLNESGHSYYVDLFQKLTKTEEGTGSRHGGGKIGIDQDAFEKFVKEDASMGQIYKLRQVKLQEMSMAAAVAFSENPASPEPGMVRPDSVTLQPGGPLREAGREIRSWWGKERTIHGRTQSQPRLLVGTNGRVTMTLGGSNIVLGTLGGAIGSVAGPPGALLGAVIGAVGPEGVAAVIDAARRGVRTEMDLSPIALQTIIGDVNSSIPENRVASQQQIQWMEEAYDLGPTDYEVINGQVVRREVIGKTGIDKDKLAKLLKGAASELLEFQAADGIPPEHRQVLDPSWIFEGTRNRTQHGTGIEQKIYEEFSADFGGFRDIHGHYVERDVPAHGPDQMVAARTLATAEAADHTQEGNFDIPAGEYLPEGILIPDQNVMAGTPPVLTIIPAHISVREEQANVDINSAVRLFRTGDPLPVGTVIPEHTLRRRRTITRPFRGSIIHPIRGEEIVIPERVLNAPEAATENFVGRHRYRPARGGIPADIIPAGTVIPEHLGPGPILPGGPGGGPLMRREVNPDFDWNDLDNIGNARRWMKAVEKVLKAENGNICQSLVDGEAKYRDRTFERFTKAKAAAKEGSKVTAEKGKMEKKKTTLTKDRDKVATQRTDTETFLKKIQQIKDKIKEAERDRESEERKVTVVLSGARVGTTVSVEQALNIVNSDDDTVTITIDSVEITALAKKRTELKDARDKLYREYKREQKVDALQKRTATAKAKVTTKEKRRDDIMGDPTYGTDPALQAEYRTIVRELPDIQRTAAVVEREFMDAQSRASAFYEKLINDPQDEDLKAKKAELDKLESLVKGAQQAIKEKKDEIEKRTKELLSSDTEKRGEAEAVITSMIYARETILSWGISPADLAGAKTFDQLLTQLNTLNASNAAIGWPKTGNNTAELRLMLLNGITEQQAANIERAVRAPQPIFNEAIDEAVWALSEMDLQVLPLAEIKKLMEARRGAIGGRALPADADINKAREEASKRHVARQRMLQRSEGDVGHRLHEVTENLNRVDTYGLPVPTVDAVLRASARYSAIISEIQDYLPRREDVARFMGVQGDLAANRDPITVASLTGATPRTAASLNADVFWDGALKTIFGTETDTDAYFKGDYGPDAALRRARETFSRDDFYDFLIRRRGLTVSALGTRIPPVGAPIPVGVTAITLTREQTVINQLLELSDEGLKVALSEAFSEGALYDYLAYKNISN